MPAARTFLSIAIIITMALFPIVAGEYGPISPAALTAHASPATSPLADDDDDDDGDDDDDDDDGDDDDDDEDGDDDDDDEDDDDEDNDNDEDDDGDDDDDDDAPPPPPPVQLAAPAPSSEVSACVSAGQALSLQLPGGAATVKVFGSSVNITLRAIDPNSVPSTPGQRLGDIVFEMTASSCGGGGMGSLAEEVNLGIAYDDPMGLSESNLTIALFQNGQWTPAPKQATDPSSNFVSASVTGLGTYVVYQR